MRRSPCLLLMMLCFLPGNAAAQAIRGQLIDDGSGLPISGGRVAVVSGAGAVTAQGRTDAEGRFLLDTRGPGTFRVRVSANGFLDYEEGPIEVADRDTVRIELRMGTSVVPIQPVRVIATPRSVQLNQVGFYERRESNPGQYIDRFAVEERKPRVVSDMLRGLNGVQLARSDPRDGPVVQYVLMRSGCLPRIMLDGAMVAAGGQVDAARGQTTMIERDARTRSDPRTMADYALDRLVEPHMVEGIEIFRSMAEIPSQWGGANAGCGLILIWTRR